jgi:hypothetical protein
MPSKQKKLVFIRLQLSVSSRVLQPVQSRYGGTPGNCRTPDNSAATVPENRNQRDQYFTAFSLHIPDMRSFIDMREIVKIGTRSRWV